MVEHVKPGALPVKAARPIRGSARSVLALLGAMGLAAAVLAPTGIALAESEAQTAEAAQTFDLVLADAQSIAIDSDSASVFEAAARGSFTVYVKPKPKPKPVVRVAASAPKYTGGGSKEQWLSAAGIAESNWGYVDYIVKRESGWNPNAVNRRSGASGLVQALPCSKVPGNCFNPVDNLRWANGYANGRYGSWQKAYEFWVRNHWW